MSQHHLKSFQRHLHAQGKRPGTQDRYVSILARFLRETDVPVESITADPVYEFLVERGNELGLSASWFNHAYPVGCQIGLKQLYANALSQI